MNIVVAIRASVMIAMVCRPPEWTFLMREAAKESEQELKDTTRLIRAMSEVAMIAGRDGKYSQTIKTQARDQRYPTNSCPEDQQAACM